MKTIRTPARFVLLFAALCLFIRALSPAAIGQPAASDRMASREHVNLGNRLNAALRFAEAIVEYEEALRFDPTNEVAKNNIAKMHNNLGIVFLKKKEYGKALQELETALKINPYDREARFNMSVLKQHMEAAGQLSAKEDSPDEQAGSGAQSKKAETKKPASAIKILTPGIKQPAPVLKSNTPSATTPLQPEGKSSAKIITAPAQPVSAPAASATPMSLDDKLTDVEVKVFGGKQKGLSVIARLKKLEIEALGEVRPGTIKDRIDFLRKSFGL